MEQYIYESHSFPDPRLPFIFHPCYTISRRDLPPNWHENIELLLCISGQGYVRCGAEEIPFCPGDLFVVNADTPHVVISDDSVSYRCLIIGKTFFEENGIPVTGLQFQPLLRDAPLSCLIEEIRLAYGSMQNAHPYAITDIRLAALQILRRLCTEYTITKTAPSISSDHVKKALTYIRSNFTTPLDLQTVADHVGISKYHLARQFRIFTGSTMIQTVNLIRCLEAKRLIEGGMQISEAALACGFESLSYFSRTYKKLLQALPSDHKANHDT